MCRFHKAFSHWCTCLFLIGPHDIFSLVHVSFSQWSTCHFSLIHKAFSHWYTCHLLISPRDFFSLVQMLALHFDMCQLIALRASSSHWSTSHFCHTRFHQENQMHNYMYARISFIHIVTSSVMNNNNIT